MTHLYGETAILAHFTVQCVIVKLAHNDHTWIQAKSLNPMVKFQVF